MDFPLPLAPTFTYSIDTETLGVVKIGQRVIVPFGSKKQYTAIVTAIDVPAPEGYRVKEVVEVVDQAPIVTRSQLQLWHWIAEYYLCTVGEVYRAAVPTGLRIESETSVELAPDYEEAMDNRLSERELIVMAALDKTDKAMTLDQLAKATGFAGINTIISRLLDKRAIIVKERLQERYTPKKVNYVELLIDPNNKQDLERGFGAVKGAPKQETALLALLDMTRGEEKAEVVRSALMERADATLSVLQTMAKKGLIALKQRVVNRFDSRGMLPQPLPELSVAQRVALQAINDQWREKDVCLLHGVTSSGKTEIYIHLANYAMESGRQVLFLVPEIALTTQLTERLQRVLGDRVIIYHSKFSDNERVDIWRKMLQEREPCLVIGARSALFLPFAQLGLVIVDEEHDPSYKQADPAPRYNARDAALVLARQHGAKALLGSATPAIDTYYKATNGKYGLARLTERFAGAILPEVELIDLKRARLKGEMDGAFALRTQRLVADAVARGEQAIVFLNRRGYAPMALCRKCGYVPRCEHCDVSLTYHKHVDRLVCHYCGTLYPLPTICPVCKEPGIEIVGYGTERIEGEVERLWPGVPTTRMDLDTTRNKEGYQRLINQFSDGKTKILVGTQMVTKGLDFAGVSTVAIVNADALVNQPDFRSAERAFNMMAQVAGRAGRRDKPGLVAVQTYNVEHPLMQYLVAHDYEGFYAHEVEERRRYGYPPFTKIIYIYIKHRDPREVDEVAVAYGRRLRELFGNRVFGPEEPLVGRVQNMYIRKLMLKVELTASMSKLKEILRALNEELHQSRMPAMRGAQVYYDVDPY